MHNDTGNTAVLPVPSNSENDLYDPQYEKTNEITVHVDTGQIEAKKEAEETIKAENTISPLEQSAQRIQELFGKEFILKDMPVIAKASTEETAAVTGKREAEELGTDNAFADEKTVEQATTGVFFVDEIEVPETEYTPMETKDMAKMILSGIVMTGIGLLIAGALSLVGVAAPVAAVASAAFTGFTSSYVNAGVGALVENQSIEEYGRSQGYQTIERYKNKLYQDAIVGATVGILISTLTLHLLYEAGPIGNSIKDDVANAVTQQTDETAAVVSQAFDDVDEVAGQGTKSLQKEISINESGSTTIHNDIVDNYAGYATQTPLNNATLYQLEGSLNGVTGRFEWITQYGNVTHRMFIQNGTMNGVPIKP